MIAVPTDIGHLDADGFADGDIPAWDAAAEQFVPTSLAAMGRWEVVVDGVPAEEITNTAGDDWLYVLVGA